MDYTLNPLDKNAKTSITQQITELILKNIEAHALAPGDKLPTERELSVRLNVARGTVKAAYKRLERMNIVRTRQGSGSFVIRDEHLSIKLRKKKAIEAITETIASMKGLGLKTSEIRQLFDLCLSQESKQVIHIAIIYDSPELLMDFKKQLSYLPTVSLAVFILESVTENHNPEALLGSFDIIITPSGYYQRVLEALPAISEKVLEAVISAGSDTIIRISALPRDSRIGIICRTNVFLSIVKENLLSFGFREESILSFFEMDYTTETYFPGGIDVLISFSDAHIFTNPAFEFRNEEFLNKGGEIIAFNYQIERGTLIYIEDRVRQLLISKEFPAE